MGLPDVPVLFYPPPRQRSDREHQKITGQLPIQKMPIKLIVLWAFDRDENGVLGPAFDAREMPDELRAR